MSVNSQARRVLTALAVLFGGTMSGTQSMSETMRPDTAIRYRSAVADDRFNTRLEIQRDGQAVLEVGSNRLTPAEPVGRFEGRIAPPLLTQLRQAGSDPAFTAAPSQPAVMPEEAHRLIEMPGPGGKAVLKVVGESLIPPPAFLSVETLMEAAIRDLHRSPIVAARVEIVAPPQQAKQNDPISLTLAVINEGPAVLRLDAPSRWGQIGTAADLAARRSDLPIAVMTMDHQRFVRLDGTRLRGSTPTVTGSEALIPPGGRLLVTFEYGLDWQPGAWRVEVELALTVYAKDGAPLFQGGAVTPPVILNVLPPAR